MIKRYAFLLILSANTFLYSGTIERDFNGKRIIVTYKKLTSRYFNYSVKDNEGTVYAKEESLVMKDPADLRIELNSPVTGNITIVAGSALGDFATIKCMGMGIKERRRLDKKERRLLSSDEAEAIRTYILGLR